MGMELGSNGKEINGKVVGGDGKVHKGIREIIGTSKKHSYVPFMNNLNFTGVTFLLLAVTFNGLANARLFTIVTFPSFTLHFGN